MNRTCLRLTGFLINPWTTVFNIKNEEIATEGLSNDLIKYLQKSLNLRYEFIPPVEEEYGIQNSNQSWTGILGMLERGEVDLSVVPATPVWSRRSAVDFSSAFWHTDTRIVSGRPDAYSNHPFSYLYIFDLQVWMMTAVTYGVLSGLIWFSDSEFCNWPERRWRLKDYFWGLFAIAVFQNAPCEPLRVVPRLSFALWCILVIVLMNTFSSEMIAHLTAPDEPERINNFRDILRRPLIIPVVPHKTAIAGFFQFSDEPLRASVWKQIVRTGGQFTIRKTNSLRTVASIREGKVVLLNENLVARMAIKNYVTTADVSPTQFYFGSHSFNAMSFCFMVNRRMNKALKEDIDLTILHYHETGHIHFRISRVFLDLMEQKSNRELNDWRFQETLLTLKHWVPAAVVWAIAMAISVVAFITEIVIGQSKRMVISRLIPGPGTSENIDLENVSNEAVIKNISSTRLSSRKVVSTDQHIFPNFVSGNNDEKV